MVPAERRFVSKRVQESNYLQAIEGGIDSSHVSFLHSGELETDPLFKGSKANRYNLEDRMPFFEVVDFEGGLLVGARRKAEHGKYYWRITPWIMPWHTIIPPRGLHGAHAGCRSTTNAAGPGASAAPTGALRPGARRRGRGIGEYVPGTFPLAGERLPHRPRQPKRGALAASGIAMQDASLRNRWERRTAPASICASPTRHRRDAD
jgi:hypothetical protein